MTTSAEIAEKVMYELGRDSWWVQHGGRPKTLEVKVGGDPYILTTKANDLKFHPNGESHRWLSVRVDVHTDGGVTTVPEVGALYFSSLGADPQTQARLAQADELVRGALERLGYRRRGAMRSASQIEREVTAVVPARRRAPRGARRRRT